MNALSALLARHTGTPAPAPSAPSPAETVDVSVLCGLSCNLCGGRQFWTDAYGCSRCEFCYPPAAEAMVLSRTILGATGEATEAVASEPLPVASVPLPPDLAADFGPPLDWGEYGVWLQYVKAPPGKCVYFRADRITKNRIRIFWTEEKIWPLEENGICFCS